MFDAGGYLVCDRTVWRKPKTVWSPPFTKYKLNDKLKTESESRKSGESCKTMIN